MNASVAHLPSNGGWRARVKKFFAPKQGKRWPAWVFLNIVSAVVIGWVAVFSWLDSTWHLGVAPIVKCLPEDYFLVGQRRPEAIERGKVYRFTAYNLGPVIKDRTPLVKIAAAVAGDTVEVSQSGIFINGQKWGDLNPDTLRKANLTVESVTRSYTVPEGKVLMLGTLPRSFDGRYFGPVETKYFTGRVIPLW